MLHVACGIMLHVACGIMLHVACGIMLHVACGIMSHVACGIMLHVACGTMLHVACGIMSPACVSAGHTAVEHSCVRSALTHAHSRTRTDGRAAASPVPAALRCSRVRAPLHRVAQARDARSLAHMHSCTHARTDDARGRARTHTQDSPQRLGPRRPANKHTHKTARVQALQYHRSALARHGTGPAWHWPGMALARLQYHRSAMPSGEKMRFLNCIAATPRTAARRRAAPTQVRPTAQLTCCQSSPAAPGSAGLAAALLRCDASLGG